MQAEDIKVGLTYTKRLGNAVDRQTVLAMFEDRNVRYVLARHPNYSTWMADVRELDRFAERAQFVVPDPPSAPTGEDK